jgi:hypothetical protein
MEEVCKKFTGRKEVIVESLTKFVFIDLDVKLAAKC